MMALIFVFMLSFVNVVAEGIVFQSVHASVRATVRESRTNIVSNVYF